MLKDDYNRKETGKVRLTRYIVLGNALYHLVKVLLPLIAMATCTYHKTHGADCNTLPDSIIDILLLIDVLYQANLLIYIVFCSLRLVWLSWRYSRHEARKHMSFFLINSIGLITGQLLYMIIIVVSYIDPNFYLSWRMGYYYDWLSQLWPALIYMLTKRNEDCFGCFNRLAPQTYSVIQFS